MPATCDRAYNFHTLTRRVFFIFLFWTTRILFGVGTPEGTPFPQNPLPVPPPDKKGTILLLLEFCIHLHTYQYLKL